MVDSIKTVYILCTFYSHIDTKDPITVLIQSNNLSKPLANLLLHPVRPLSGFSLVRFRSEYSRPKPRGYLVIKLKY